MTARVRRLFVFVLLLLSFRQKRQIKSNRFMTIILIEINEILIYRASQFWDESSCNGAYTVVRSTAIHFAK